MASKSNNSAISSSKKFPSDIYLTPDLVGSVCTESCEKMQLVADLLLLQSVHHTSATILKNQPAVLEPLSQGNESFGKSRDAIVANTKALAISIKDLSRQLNRRSLGGAQQVVEHISDQVIILIEAAAHAAYFASLTDINCKPAQPGVVDRYAFERAKQVLHISYDKFQPDHNLLVTREHILSTSKTFADNLGILTRGCKMASENIKLCETDRKQFLNCMQCLQGTTATFLESLKGYASSHTSENRKRCLLFGKPLLTAVDCIVEFSSFPQFAGKPADLTFKGREYQTEILGAAMAVISSTIQLLGNTKDLLEGGNDSSGANWQKITNCTKAVADATKLLSSSIREHTPVPSRRPSI